MPAGLGEGTRVSRAATRVYLHPAPSCPFPWGALCLCQHRGVDLARGLPGCCGQRGLPGAHEGYGSLSPLPCPLSRDHAMMARLDRETRPSRDATHMPLQADRHVSAVMGAVDA